MLLHCLGSLTCREHKAALIFGHFHLGRSFLWFSQCVSFDVYRHVEFQLSTSSGRYRTLISVSESLEWPLYIIMNYSRTPSGGMIRGKNGHPFQCVHNDTLITPIEWSRKHLKAKPFILKRSLNNQDLKRHQNTSLKVQQEITETPICTSSWSPLKNNVKL